MLEKHFSELDRGGFCNTEHCSLCNQFSDHSAGVCRPCGSNERIQRVKYDVFMANHGHGQGENAGFVWKKNLFTLTKRERG